MAQKIFSFFAVIFLILAHQNASALTWNADLRIHTPGPASAFGNFGKSISVDGSDFINMVWFQSLEPVNNKEPFLYSGKGLLFFSQSNDKGANWSGTPLTEILPTISLPKIATYGQHIYIVFPAAETADTTLKIFILHGLRIANEVQWSPPVVISDTPLGHNATFPVIAANADGPHVAWVDDRTGTAEVYYTKSNDFGGSWSTPIAVSPVDGKESWTPSLAISSNHVHVAWTDARFGKANCTKDASNCHEVLYYRHSSDSGSHWENEKQLTCDTSIYTFAPSLAVENSTVHMAYFQGIPFSPGVMKLYYLKSEKNGNNFATCAGTKGRIPALNIKYPAGDKVLTSWRPDIAVKNGLVHMVWWGELTNDYNYGQAKVYYAQNNGYFWTPATAITPQSNDTYRSFTPNIAVSQNGLNIYTMWADHRDDATKDNPNYQIYFRSADTN